MTFGENLKMLRKSRDLTQEDLAKMIGVRQVTVSAWERGAREPNFETCEIIADALNIPLSSVMLPAAPHADDDYVRYVASYLHSDPKRRLLFDMSTKATSSEIDAVLSVFKAILKERDPDVEQ